MCSLGGAGSALMAGQAASVPDTGLLAPRYGVTAIPTLNADFGAGAPQCHNNPDAAELTAVVLVTSHACWESRSHGQLLRSPRLCVCVCVCGVHHVTFEGFLGWVYLTPLGAWVHDPFGLP